MSGGKYTDTTGSLARDAGVAQPTVRLYADEDLLDFVMASNGAACLIRACSRCST
jgi:hypothetical protein